MWIREMKLGASSKELDCWRTVQTGLICTSERLQLTRWRCAALNEGVQEADKIRH